MWFVWVGVGQLELAWVGEVIARGNKHNLVIVTVWGGLRMLPQSRHTRPDALHYQFKTHSPTHPW